MPRQPKLSPELVALLHHIELHKSGWWDRAFQQLILAVLWMSGTALVLSEIGSALRKSFAVTLSDDEISPQLDALVSAGCMVQLPAGQYKICEATALSLEGGIAESKAIEVAASEAFNRLVNRYCPSIASRAMWSNFNARFLRPFVRRAGARTYQLLSAKGQLIDVSSTSEYIDRFPPNFRRGICRVFDEFFSPESSDTRAYILRALNAYFIVQSSSLSTDTVRALRALTDTQPVLKLFLDTNVLLVLLDLDAKGRGYGLSKLTTLISSLKDSVIVKLYVLPETVDEARRVLTAVCAEMRPLRLTPKLLDAFLNLASSGISLRYLHECKGVGRRVDPDVYFGPYLNHFVQVIRSKGIELFNAVLRNRQVSDASDARALFDSLHPAADAVAPQRLDHDFRMWQFVGAARPQNVGSALEAEYWILTLDRHLLEFDDRYWKKRSQACSLPLCLHPTTLFQMLGLWVPRTAELEEAIMGSLGPVMSHQFDALSAVATLTARI